MKQYEQPVKSLEELLEAHRKLPEVVEWCETCLLYTSSGEPWPMWS